MFLLVLKVSVADLHFNSPVAKIAITVTPRYATVRDSLLFNLSSRMIFVLGYWPN